MAIRASCTNQDGGPDQGRTLGVTRCGGRHTNILSGVAKFSLIPCMESKLVITWGMNPYSLYFHLKQKKKQAEIAAKELYDLMEMKKHKSEGGFQRQ